MVFPRLACFSSLLCLVCYCGGNFDPHTPANPPFFLVDLPCLRQRPTRRGLEVDQLAIRQDRRSRVLMAGDPVFPG